MMRSMRWLVWLLACGLSALLAVAQVPATLYVHSTIDALLAGAYEGDLTVSELRGKGDLAIGTFDRLDGELIGVDGVIYHARADGSVSVAGAGETTPLVYAVRFLPERKIKLDGAADLAAIEKKLDAQMSNPNLFYAVRVEGIFQAVTVRAIAAQTKPYKPLAELVATQSVHKLEGVRGTLIGLRSPAFSKGISVPGYHWHFVTADRSRGGHVLALTFAQGEARLQSIAHMELDLPKTEGFAKADQSRDRSTETRLVEGK